MQGDLVELDEAGRESGETTRMSRSTRTMQPDPAVVHYARVVGNAFLLTVVAVTSVVIVGWTLDVRWLATPVGRSEPMKINSAVVLLLCSCAIFFWRRHPRSTFAARAVRVVGALVAAYGSAILSEYVLGRSLGIDELLTRDHWNAGNLTPGRPAPQAAVVLIAIGMTLVLPSRMRRLRDGLVVAAIVASLLALLGRVADVNQFVVIGGTYGVPVEASVIFILTALGFVLTSRPADTTLSRVIAASPGGVLLRRLIPAVVALPLVAGALYALAIGSHALNERTAGWLVTVIVLAIAMGVGWRAANLVDDLDEARAGEHDRLQAIVAALPFNINVFDTAGKARAVDLGAAGLPHTERAQSDKLVAAALAGRREHLAWTETTDGSSHSMEADGVPITRNGHTVTGAVTVSRDVTELVDAKERYQILFDTIPEGVYEIAVDGTLLVANEPFARLLGYDDVRSLMAGVTNVRTIWAEPTERLDIIGRIQRGTTSGTTDVRFKRRDGQVVVADLSFNVVRDPSGRVKGLRGTVRDVTDERDVARQAADADERFRVALEAARHLAVRQATMATATANMARHILTDTIAADVMSYAAATLVETLGVDAAAIYTPGPAGEMSLVAQSGIEGRLLATTALTASANTVVAECVHSGSTIVVKDWTAETLHGPPALIAAQGARSGIAAPLQGSDGCGGAIVVASIEQRAFAAEEIAFVEGLARLLCLAQHTARANAQLARSEHTLSAFVDNAPAAVSLLDGDGRFVLVNREAERVMGAPRSAILGRSRDEIPTLREVQTDRDNEVTVINSRQPVTFEETARLDDGDHSYVSVRFPLIDETGSVFGVGDISTDITPMKRLQAEADRATHETIRRLAIAVELRDEETGHHIDRMAAYCELIALHLDLGADHAAMLRRAAPLHDVGKIAIPDRILLKAGALTAGERTMMQSHTEVGYQLLSGTGSDELDLAASIARTHHERVDGTGYPRQLRGEEIPFEGRIASVADVFDALTSDRVYHSAVSIEAAADYLRAGRGTSFDAVIVDVLIEHLDEADDIRRRYADEHLRPAPYGLSETRSAGQLTD